MKIYVSLRGVEHLTRPVREIPLEERMEILKERLTTTTSVVKKKHNISNRTLAHIIFHNKNLTRKIEDENFKKFNI